MGNKACAIKKFRTHFRSFGEIWLFTQIILLITVLPFLFRFLSLPKVMKMLAPRNLGVCRNKDLENMKDKIVKFTDYILRHNLWTDKNTCLRRSLVLYHFLRKLGINVFVCFGVRYNEMLSDREAKKKLEGHAWLLYHGDIFLERNAEVIKTYTMTYCFSDKMEQIG
ncbi:MAG: lasso peptide biosynthesis B2 protein [Candidatus Kuenenia sp.]|nr:lasso peptide biosynthesis B2 protein [Candidatus Kuenenia sp.]